MTTTTTSFGYVTTYGHGPSRELLPADEAVRRDALLAARSHVDKWGRDLLGDAVYDATVLAGVVVARGRNEMVRARSRNMPDPEWFHLTPAAMDAVRTGTFWMDYNPGQWLYGVRVLVGPEVEDYCTAGPYWVRRDVTERMKQVAEPGRIRELLVGELELWCRRHGVQPVEPPTIDWHKNPPHPVYGQVETAYVRADTRPLPGVFLG